MQLVVFGHIPPPHHGQSQMVQLLLDAAARPGSGIECRHVNAQLSHSLKDVGSFRAGKLGRLLGYGAQALRFRFRDGARNLYYIPAPAKRAAIYRDWIVLALCRPFFSRVIFHWHAFGLGEWSETEARPWERLLVRLLHRRADLSIVLSAFNRTDAAKLGPRRLEVVANGLPDPCRDFAETVLPARRARWRARHENAGGVVEFCVLYLAHCTREKGLFDTVDGVALANAELIAAGASYRMVLAIAGSFMNAAEQGELEERLRQPDLQLPDGSAAAKYAGFLETSAKDRAFREADAFCFPTFYAGETFGLTLVEANAYGLPIVVTRWRGLPEVAGPAAVLVDPGAPPQIAQALIASARAEPFMAARANFMDRFSEEIFSREICRVLGTVESS